MDVVRHCRVVLAIFSACLVSPAAAFQVDVGPEAVVMDSGYDKPALFPHRRHQDWYGCTACHHAKGQVMTIDRCGACHNESVKNVKFDNVKKAAHALCKDCHARERAN